MTPTVTLSTSTIDAVREALKPFAIEGRRYDTGYDSAWEAEEVIVTIGDLRKAAAALALLDLEKQNG